TMTVLERVVSANGGLPPPPPGATPGGPDTGLIVRFDGARWVDEIDRDWSAGVPFSLPDHDVFRIDANASPPAPLGADPAVRRVGGRLALSAAWAPCSSTWRCDRRPGSSSCRTPRRGTPSGSSRCCAGT